MHKQLQHLKAQLFSKGIENPEAVVAAAPTELSASKWNTISGGFGQVLFYQVFDQIHTASPQIAPGPCG